MHSTTPISVIPSRLASVKAPSSICSAQDNSKPKQCQYWLAVNRSIVLSLSLKAGQLIVNQIKTYASYGQNNNPECLNPAHNSANSNNTPWQSQMGWNQEVFDPISGLVNLRARYYIPGLKQFISGDLVDSGNKYAYAQADPINHFDPTGLLTKGAGVGYALSLVIASLAFIAAGFIFPPSLLAGGEASLVMLFKASLTVFAGGALSSGVGSVVSQQIDKRQIDWWPDVGASAIIGGAMTVLTYNAGIISAYKVLNNSRAIMKSTSLLAPIPKISVTPKLMLLNAAIFGGAEAANYGFSQWSLNQRIDGWQLGLNMALGLAGGMAFGFFSARSLNRELHDYSGSLLRKNQLKVASLRARQQQLAKTHSLVVYSPLFFAEEWRKIHERMPAFSSPVTLDNAALLSGEAYANQF